MSVYMRSTQLVWSRNVHYKGVSGTVGSRCPLDVKSLKVTRLCFSRGKCLYEGYSGVDDPSDSFIIAH